MDKLKIGFRPNTGEKVETARGVYQVEKWSESMVLINVVTGKQTVYTWEAINEAYKAGKLKRFSKSGQRNTFK